MDVLVSNFEDLRRALTAKRAVIGVCGLGYVGLPLALATSTAGFRVVGFDIDESKVERLKLKDSYLGTVPSGAVADAISGGRFSASSDFSRLAECDVIVICVPTPLTRHREPDLTFVEATTEAIARTLRHGQLVILESTTYPGTTSEVVRPILDRRGLVCGKDYFLGFSPEREDPGNAQFSTTTIPKIVSGDGQPASQLVALFYGNVVKDVVVVSSNETAEAVKITENIFRAVNIALVNELKLIFEAMGIDIWEVIDAAKTKPFGFMPFYPGPGLGGHCIPIDPFYLTWKAREHGVPTRFIELAGEINSAMPRHVVSRLEEALDLRCGKRLGESRILILGLAYKKNVSDTRESPALKLMELLERRGADVSFHDPLVAVIPATREYPELAGKESLTLTPASVETHDAILIVTDHDCIDYADLEHATLIVDTRNACARRGFAWGNIVKA